MRRDHDPRRAVQVRDQASRRVKRLTTGFVAGATVLTAAFAGIAAGSTHFTKRVVQRVARTPAHTQPKAKTQTVTAPTPALVPNGSNATPAPQQQQVQPQTQVAQSAAPPVVVSGGS